MEIDKKTKQKIKKAFYTTISILACGAFLYGLGTFHPNYFILNKIEKTHKDNATQQILAFEQDYLKKLKDLGFREPEFVYNDKASFIKTMYRCIDYINFTTDKDKRVPSSILVAMAGVESAWGTSRFAVEGNNLFGIRTWDENVPQMKPKAIPNARFGVRKFETKCESVGEVIRILNNHPAYTEFRQARYEGKDYKAMLEGIKAWSTNEEYSKIIYQSIVDNKLP